jgi:hypothetical protein
MCGVNERLKAASSSGMTSLWVMVSSALSVGWGMIEAVTFLYLIPFPSALMYSMKHKFQKQY